MNKWSRNGTELSCSNPQLQSDTMFVECIVGFESNKITEWRRREFQAVHQLRSATSRDGICSKQLRHRSGEQLWSHSARGANGVVFVQIHAQTEVLLESTTIGCVGLRKIELGCVVR